MNAIRFGSVIEVKEVVWQPAHLDRELRYEGNTDNAKKLLIFQRSDSVSDSFYRQLRKVDADYARMPVYTMITDTCNPFGETLLLTGPDALNLDEDTCGQLFESSHDKEMVIEVAIPPGETRRRFQATHLFLDA